MKFPKPSIAASVLAALLNGLAATAASAQEIPPRGPMPFTAFDRDGNGFISEREFATVRRERMEARMAMARERCDTNSARMFSWMDTDGDGKLSPEELEAGQSARMGGQRPMGMGRGMGYGPGMSNEPGTDYGPGSGMGRGMGYGPGSGMGMGRGMGYGPGPGTGMGRGMGMMRNRPDFSTFDLDGDGVIIEEEFYTARNDRIRERMEQGYRMRRLPNAPTFADIDTDGNGEISTEEFAAHQSMGPMGRMP